MLIRVLLIFICLTAGAQEELKNPDTAFKAFVSAFLEKDMEKLKKLTLYNEELDVLAQAQTPQGEELRNAKKTLQELSIKWYEVGDIVKIRGAPIKVNDIMVNDRRKLGTIRLLDFVYPVIVRKLRAGNIWKVDPTFVINSIKKKLKNEQKFKRKDFRIILDGKAFHLNEGEKIIAKTDDGKEHRIVLFKNEIQHYKDGRIAFHYHRDMDVFPNKMQDGSVYTLSTDLGPEIHILVYKPGTELKAAMDKYIKVWVENYEVKDSQFEKNLLKDTRQEINGKEYPGKVMYVKEGLRVVYNQFYFFELNGTVVGLFARCKTSDTGLLNQYLKIVCEQIVPGRPGVKK